MQQAEAARTGHEHRRGIPWTERAKHILRPFRPPHPPTPTTTSVPRTISETSPLTLRSTRHECSLAYNDSCKFAPPLSRSSAPVVSDESGIGDTPDTPVLRRLVLVTFVFARGREKDKRQRKRFHRYRQRAKHKKEHTVDLEESIHLRFAYIHQMH